MFSKSFGRTRHWGNIRWSYNDCSQGFCESSLLANKPSTFQKCQQGGGDIMVWTIIIGDKVVEPFILFLFSNKTTHNVQLFTSIGCQSMVYHGERLIDWPPLSPDSSPIENFWPNIKGKFTKMDVNICQQRGPLGCYQA